MEGEGGKEGGRCKHAYPRPDPNKGKGAEKCPQRTFFIKKNVNGLIPIISFLPFPRYF